MSRLLLLLVLITLFYAPLASPDATIHWDAGGYFHPYQKYFADSLHSGRLPFWTSSIFSGFPFLADMQVAAWYPLHWPFYLAGIGPKSLFAELWLHALLAAAGAYLLARHATGDPTAALYAGLFYPLSGFFAGHSQHVGLFAAASWLPLLAYLLLTAHTRGRQFVLALAGGCFCLAGHFQTVLYGFAALALLALWRRECLRRFALLVAASAALSAIQLLPTAELVRHSLRARFHAVEQPGGSIAIRSLATFVYPDAVGTFRKPYPGPPDISQQYVYSGLLFLPLALAGLASSRLRTMSLVLIVPALVYALGPQTPLFGLIARLPGFSSVRAPAHVMFVVILGLALAAAAGVQRMPRARWLHAILISLIFADLLFFNMVRSPLVRERGRFEELFAFPQRWFQEQVGKQQPLERFAAPGRWEYLYPSQVPFGLGVESTFGDNPLLLSRYYEYLAAIHGNPRLMSTLGVSRYWDRAEWVVRDYAPALPRFHAPELVLPAPTPEDSRRALSSLDPLREAVAEGIVVPHRNTRATLAIDHAAEDAYQLTTEAESDLIVRVAIPYYPGWHAEIDGHQTPVFPMDHALMGLRVPKGRHTVSLAFHSTYFAAGATISGVALAMCMTVGLASASGAVQRASKHSH
ncbi:MAG: YfhO family protein [Bryobacteraceae bacterium]